MPILDKQNKELIAKYDCYLQASPYANAMQDRGWAYVKEGWEGGQVYLTDTGTADGEIIAAMSLIFRPIPGGFTLAYAPRGPVCDARDIALVGRLIEEAKPLLQQKRAFVLRMDPELSYDEELCRIYSDNGYQVRSRGKDDAVLIQSRMNMMLDIGGKSFDDLMPGFSEKTRYNIRYAFRKGVTVRYSRTKEDLEIFYDLYRITCERDRIGYRPFDYFERMLEVYGEDQLRIYLAEHEGEALSAAIALGYGEKMWYIYGASSNEKRNLMPNYAMQSEMIRWGIECGKRVYDFGAVFHLDKANGLFKFKEGFCRSQGVTELVGEFDFVLKPFIYRAFSVYLPKLKKLLSKHK